VGGFLTLAVPRQTNQRPLRMLTPTRTTLICSKSQSCSQLHTRPRRCALGKRLVKCDQLYRVVRTLLSAVLTIIKPEPETPLNQEDYPLGKVIVLTDPSTSPLN